MKIEQRYLALQGFGYHLDSHSAGVDVLFSVEVRIFKKAETLTVHIGVHQR